MNLIRIDIQLLSTNQNYCQIFKKCHFSQSYYLVSQNLIWKLLSFSLLINVVGVDSRLFSVRFIN